MMVAVFSGNQPYLITLHGGSPLANLSQVQVRDTGFGGYVPQKPYENRPKRQVLLICCLNL